ncbi:hypothetical protein P43SY_001763 [Pythium insidiosum]|uniref:MMS19 nucleotide excision repair protein n=1 Tax=Pythium insidiosum TaxID=114742 RepID=A0AAD5M709_PYTIN|nr:hypothetical protein P43SY_001763 [Pythium insidiosum]
MFSLDAPLQPAIDAFVNPENDDTAHKTSLNTVVMQVHRKVPVESLIQSLGIHLTSTDDKVRARGTLLLAEVLTRLPELPLTPNAVQLLLTFFVDRLADFPSANACLQALLALLSNHAAHIPSAMTVVELIQRLVQALHVPQLGQAMRKQCYSLMQTALELSPVKNLLLEKDELGREFAQAFLSSMEGEKDPRNLLLCLKIARELLVALAPVFEKHDGVLLQQYFDVVSCYFPITFTPPPNDPYGITSEELILSLRKAMAASDLVARHVLPFLLEKLSTTVVEAKLDSIQTLVFCCESYSMNVLLLHLHAIATAFYHEVMKGEKKDVIAASLQAIARFAGAIAQAKTKSIGGASYAWNKFVVELTKRAVDDLRGNAVDSMASASAGKVLAALGKESGPAFSHVLEHAVPLVVEQFEESLGSPSKTEAALGRLLLLVDTIDQEIDQSADAQPMRPHAQQIIDALVAFLETHKGVSAESAVHAKSKGLAIEALSHLVTYPPSPIVATEQVQSLVALLTEFLLHDASADVRAACLSSLQAISTIRQKSTVQQYATFVMDICLVQLMHAVTKDNGNRSPRASSQEDVLRAITALCRQPTIFRATIVQLVDLCVVGSDAGETLATDTMAAFVAGLLHAVADIVELNADEPECMEFCAAASTEQSESSQRSIVFRLLAATAQTAAVAATSDSVLPSDVLESGVRIFRTVTQNVSVATQQALVQESIATFLRTQSSPVAPHAASLQLVPLFAAVVNSANRAVRLPDASLVINRLLDLAQSSNASDDGPTAALRQAAALSAAKALASIINKMSDGDEFDTLIHLLVETKLARAIMCDTDPLSTRVTALQIYVWIAKALVIRGHRTHAPHCLGFLCQFLTSPTGSPSPLQMEVAKSFKLLVNEAPDVLNRKCGASITFLHRQRTFDLVVPTLLEFIRSQTPTNAAAAATTTSAPALVALSHVIASSPKAMYMPHLGSIFPLMVLAINADDRELGSSAIGTFRALLFESVETAKPFLKDVFPGLLKQAQQGAGALERRDALECLAKLATIPYELIHPYKDTVLKHLQQCLDDRKRFVRHAAVRVRNHHTNAPAPTIMRLMKGSDRGRADVVALWKAARSHDAARVKQIILDASSAQQSLAIVNEFHPKKGTTALMVACQKREKFRSVSVVGASGGGTRSAADVVRVLLEFGADVGLHEKGADGHTALHYAAISNQVRSVEHMLHAGADAFALNRHGHAPIDLARWGRNRAVIDVLTQHTRVRSGWLYMKKTSKHGLRLWRRRFCVALACNVERTQLEFSIYKDPDDLRPRAVLLLRVGTHAMVTSPKKGWLDKPHMFHVDRPIVVQHMNIKRRFSRDEDAQVMSEEIGDLQQFQFACETDEERDAWMALLQHVQVTAVPVETRFPEATTPPVLFPTAARPQYVASASTALSVDQTTLSGHLSASVSSASDHSSHPSSPFGASVPSYSSTPATTSASGHAEAPPSCTSSAGSSSASEVRVTAPVAHVWPPPVAAVMQDPSHAPSAPSFDEGFEDVTAIAALQIHSQAPAQRQDETPAAIVPVSPPWVQSHSSASDDSTASSRSECVICMDASRDAICVPCGHLAGCFSCLSRHADQEKSCPICRGAVHTVVKVYEC